MIVGQNALLNQYVPTFFIKDLRDGQSVIYDSVRKAFINSDVGGGGGATRLGQLEDVSSSVDNPLSVQNGQALVYDSFTNLWTNTFIDYNTLLNKPTANSLLPPQAGHTGEFLTTDGTNLSWASVSGSGTVTSVTVNGTAGRITSIGSPITSSGIITLDLTPTTVVPGAYTSANIIVDAFGRITSATNGSGGGGVTSVSGTAGNITSTGGTNPVINLATITQASLGSFWKFAYDSYGRVTGHTAVVSSDITAALGYTPGVGTVTSIAATGSSDITVGGSPITAAGTLTFALSNTAVTPNTYGSSTQVPVFTVDSKGRITNVSNTPIASGSGTVTSVSVVGGSGRITSFGSPITTSGSISLDLATTGVVSGSYTLASITVDSYGRIISASNGSGGGGTVTSVGMTVPSFLSVTPASITTSGTFAVTLSGTALAIANGGTGATTATNAINNLLPSQGANSGKFLTTNGSNVSWATISGSGTVTSVGLSTTTLSLGGTNPVTTSGTISVNLPTTGVTPASYTSADITVDAYGRITSASNGAAGASTTETVIFHYGPGSAGNFSPVDAIYSQTSGVTATVTDAANCIVSYAFTGKSNQPKSILTYAQVYSTNNFVIKDTTSLPSSYMAGGGTSAAPALITSFGAANTLTLQTRMSDTGASASVGQRAYLIVMFGF